MIRYLFLAIFLSFISCEEPQQEQIVTTEKDVLEDWEIDKICVDKEKEIMDSIMEEKSFTFNRIAECEEVAAYSDTISISKERPFVIKKSVLKDTTVITFNVMTYCDNYYKSDIHYYHEDTLTLSFHNVAGNFEECMCTFTYQFKINTKINKYKIIKLRNVIIN